MSDERAAPVKEQMEAAYTQWFAKLQSLTERELDPDGGWFGRWFDYWTPEDALAAGPEGEPW